MPRRMFKDVAMTHTNVDNFNVVTLVLPDPLPFSPFRRDYSQLNENISYNYNLPEDLIPLASENAVAGTHISGLLYLPYLGPEKQCRELIWDYAARNTTSNADLPPSNTFWTWIAVVPWINAQCSLDFLHAALDDDLRAMLFFVPDGKAEVPAADSPVWDLNDGGAWKKNLRFPVYAISGRSGASILRAMSQYSGNITDVPFGHALVNQFPPGAYVRVAGDLMLEGHATLPTLWLIFLIVVCILIVVITSIYLTLSCIRWKRRQILMKRIQAGDVDLEQLGIRKLTIPPDILNRMPLYTYQQRDASDETEADNSTDMNNDDTCAICVEEFIPGRSTVRQLPCEHIFHSACIDDFLRQTSSLCPLCKKTSLPTGYCPPVITNSMVQRERRIRTMRDRVPRNIENPFLKWLIELKNGAILAGYSMRFLDFNRMDSDMNSQARHLRVPGDNDAWERAVQKANRKFPAKHEQPQSAFWWKRNKIRRS